MIKEDFPSPPKWIYKKWYFWVVMILYSVLTEFKSYANFYIAEILGSLFGSFLIVSVVFLIIYYIAKHRYKKSKNK